MFWTNVSSKHSPSSLQCEYFSPSWCNLLCTRTLSRTKGKHAWLQIECWVDVRTAGGSDNFTAPATEHNAFFSRVKMMIPGERNDSSAPVTSILHVKYQWGCQAQRWRHARVLFLSSKVFKTYKIILGCGKLRRQCSRESVEAQPSSAPENMTFTWAFNIASSLTVC